MTPSYYYKYNFVSPEPLYARVKEDLKSWFDTGVVDDALFPLWVDDCLKKFHKTYLKIEEAALIVENFKAPLPDDFDSVREAWLCTQTMSSPVQHPSAFYYQTDCRLTNITDRCNACFGTGNSCDNCTQEYLVTNKITGAVAFKYQKMYLLRPGNKNAIGHCGVACSNLTIDNCPDTFDIRDGNMITSFSCGTIHLTYYSKQYDCNGNQLVPDNHFIQDYIRKYIKYMIMTQLFNQATDDTFSQARFRMELADREQASAFITANVESRKKTQDQMMQDIKRSYNRHNKYRLK